jgi:hypothetical protein
VLQALCESGNTVIPCTFGVLFKTKENLAHFVADDYQRLETLFLSLSGREEWGIKVYVDNEKCIKQFKQHDTEAQALVMQKGAASEGMQWYVEKKIDELLKMRLGEELEQWIKDIVDSLEGYGEPIVLHDAFSERPKDRSHDLVLNTSCLIKKSDAADFHRQWGVFFKQYISKGLYCKLTGPWPPYSFVKGERV